MLHDLGGTPGRYDPFLGLGAVGLDANGQGVTELSVAQDLHRLAPLHEPALPQGGEIHDAPRRKVSQVAEIDDGELTSKQIVEPSLRKSALEGRLPPLEAGARSATRARPVAFVTAAGRLSVP